MVWNRRNNQVILSYRLILLKHCYQTSTVISSLCFPLLSGPIRVQESDGSFFESYTALCWKQENRRLQVLREDDITSGDLAQNDSTDDIADPTTYKEVGPNS